MSRKAQNVQEASRCKGLQENTPESGIKCAYLNARSIINKKNELNIMVDDIKSHIIGITESWANNDIIYAELGLEGYVMFMKDIIGGRGGGVLLYIKETIPAYEVQLQEEADCNEAIWCKLVTGHTTVTIGDVYRCPNITKQNNEKIHNAISEVSKGVLRYNNYCISIVNTNQAQLMIVYKASNVCILLTFVSAIFSNLQLYIYYYSFRLLHYTPRQLH